MQKNRPNVINLGMYARKRDIVTNRGAGMAEVAQVMKGLVLNKGSKEDRYSDWEQLTLSTRQVSIVSTLLRFYQSTLQLNQLT